MKNNELEYFCEISNCEDFYIMSLGYGATKYFHGVLVDHFLGVRAICEFTLNYHEKEDIIYKYIDDFNAESFKFRFESIERAIKDFIKIVKRFEICE